MEWFVVYCLELAKGPLKVCYFGSYLVHFQQAAWKVKNNKSSLYLLPQSSDYINELHKFINAI